MLRVYSVLYIERLWNNDSTISQNKHLIHSSDSSTSSQIIVTDAHISRQIQEEEEEEEQNVIVEEPEEEEEEERTKDYQESLKGNIAHQTDMKPLADQTENKTPAEEIEISSNHSKISLDKDVSQQQQEENEDIVHSLAIDTNNLQGFSDNAAADDAQVQAEVMSIIQEQTSPVVVAVTEKSADQPTSISSSSSILPPLTPSSVHSLVGIHPEFHLEKSKSTSLIRRETQKMNDKRKSLTKKIKRVLLVKSENKRKSV